MDELLDGWASYYFLCWATERPLRSGTSSLWAISSLSSHLSGLLLQPNSFLRAAVTMLLATSSCNPACQGPRPSLVLCCAQPCHCILSQTVANADSRSVAPNRPMFVQRWQWGRFRTAPNVSVFGAYEKSSSRYSLVQILPASSSKVLWACQSFFNTLKCKPSSCHSPVHFFRQLLQIEARTCGNRDTQGTHPPKKQRVWRSPVNSRVPELLLFSAARTGKLLLLTMWLTWWQDCPWTFVRNFKTSFEYSIYRFCLNDGTPSKKITSMGIIMTN